MMILYRAFLCFTFMLLTKKLSANADEYSSGADYLQNAIRDIVEINSERNSNLYNLINNQAATPSKKSRLTSTSSLFIDGNRRFSRGEQQNHQPQPTIHQHTYQNDFYQPDNNVQPTAQAQVQGQAGSGIPEPPSLTKGELAALYEAAVSAGHSVQMSAPTATGGLHDQLPLQAALHEIKDSAAQSDTEGYYYYYYPLKSFQDGIPAHVPKATYVPKDHYKTPIVTSYNTHLHNVKVEPMYPVEHKGNKAMEPLFMAISSFVGMAMMFLFSTVVLPRLTGGLKKIIRGGSGGGKGTNTNTNSGTSRPKTKITIISRNSSKNNRNKNNNRNNFKNNQNNYKNNNKNNRKKGRFLDGYVDWRHLIANFGDMFECTSCEDHTELGPYNGVLRNGTPRSWN